MKNVFTAVCLATLLVISGCSVSTGVRYEGRNAGHGHYHGQTFHSHGPASRDHHHQGNAGKNRGHKGKKGKGHGRGNNGKGRGHK